MKQGKNAQHNVLINEKGNPLIRITSTITVILSVIFFSGILITDRAEAGAYEQLQGMTGGGSVFVPPVGDPQCVSGCDNSGTGGSDSSTNQGGSWINNWQIQQQMQEEQRKTEAYSLNEQGNRAYERRDWKAAIDFYEKALRNSPDDKVIQQNLENAKYEKNRQVELLKAQSEFRMRMEKLTALMPVSKPLLSSGGERGSSFERAKVPLPGFSSDQWKEYLAVRDEANRLYLKLNRDGELSDADAQAFFAALSRRNELWTMVMEQPLAAAERDKLRLSLPIVVNKALLNLSAVLQGTYSGGQGSASPVTAQPAVSPDRRTAPASGNRPSQSDPITNAFVADFFSDKITKLSENDVGKAVGAAHGTNMKDTFKNLLGIAKVAVKAREGGGAGAGAETADLILSKIPEPSVAARAEHAVEGGRMYSNVTYRALNRFMADAMSATGASFDSEDFWKRYNESLTESQKGEKKWIQFGE